MFKILLNTHKESLNLSNLDDLSLHLSFALCNLNAMQEIHISSFLYNEIPITHLTGNLTKAQLLCLIDKINEIKKNIDPEASTAQLFGALHYSDKDIIGTIDQMESIVLSTLASTDDQSILETMQKKSANLNQDIKNLLSLFETNQINLSDLKTKVINSNIVIKPFGTTYLLVQTPQ